MIKSKFLKTCSLVFALVPTLFSPALSQEVQQTETPKCVTHDYSKSGYPTWFLGLHPMDDLIAAWCRLQQLPGNVRFNVLFPLTKVHKTWETNFEGGLPPDQIYKIVQSLLPMKDGPAANDDGMEFHKVLQNVVQLQATETPTGYQLGFPSDHPSAKELVLWEPITLRVRPVVMDGQEFTLSVNLKPSLGLLSLALQKQTTDLVFHGWKGRMDTGGFLGTTCSSNFPDCEGIPEVAQFHAPWIVYSASLVAVGENMTHSAVKIMNKLSAGPQVGTVLGPSMDTTTGSGSFSVENQLSKMKMTAKGSSSGTSEIEIIWEATSGPDTIDDQLSKMADIFRAGSKSERVVPDAPDVLDKL